MIQLKFPNLFIIGAMKSGTTSLHDCLALHPDIFMSRFKEPQYFAPHQLPFYGMWGQGHDLPEPGIDWYLQLFKDAGKVRYAGESSTAYTRAPQTPDCAERIYAFNPDAKLIYIMRDPVERTISHYWHMCVYGKETKPILKAIKSEEIYTAVSNYKMQLDPYLRLFGRDRIYCLTMEEMCRDPSKTLTGLLAWMGIDCCVDRLQFMHQNSQSRFVSQTRRGLEVYHTLQFHWRWKRLAIRLPDAAAMLHRLCTKSVDRKSVDLEPVKAYLQKIQQPQVHKLSTMIDRNFSEWRTLWDSHKVEAQNRSDSNIIEIQTKTRA